MPKIEVKVVEARKVGSIQKKSDHFFVRFYMKSERDLVEVVDTKKVVGSCVSEVVKFDESFFIENSSSNDHDLQKQKIVFELRRKKESGLSGVWMPTSSKLVGKLEISIHDLISSQSGLFSLNNDTRHMGVLHLQVKLTSLSQDLRKERTKRRMENLDRHDYSYTSYHDQDAIFGMV